eukprot:TRINITY_DN1287_c0_g1_i5.p1 TRINITY_DN1287_c0_g1~~TRINITY_DN1287_c0_g1_i5.p1  ORF type:complete len:496 (-),score=66.87 TRINITY_DN1287_c0_g1_i5:311-1798(-)
MCIRDRVTPMLFYEPSNEDDVLTVTTAMFSEECQKKIAEAKITEIYITSNADPEMVQVYAASPNNGYTGSLNIPLAQGATSPFIEYIEPLEILVTAFQGQDGVHVQFRDTSSPNTVLKEFKKNNEKVLFTKSHADYLLIATTTSVSIQQITKNLGENLYSLRIPSTAITNIDGAFSVDFFIESNTAIFVGARHPHQHCLDTGDSLELFISSSTSPSSIIPNKYYCIPLLDLSVDNIISIDISVAPSVSDPSLYEAMVVYDTLDQPADAHKLKVIKAVTFQIDENRDIVHVEIGNSYLDLGTSPSVKLVSGDNDLFVFEVHTESVCQSGVIFNNGNTNKCLISKRVHDESFTVFQNVRGLMSYNWGTLSEFKRKMQNEEYINSCDHRVMHGRFNNGRVPRGAVLRSKNGISNHLQAYVVSEVASFDQQPSVTRFFCGYSNSRYYFDKLDNFVVSLQTFDLLEFEVFDYLAELPVGIRLTNDKKEGEIEVKEEAVVI